MNIIIGAFALVLIWILSDKLGKVTDKLEKIDKIERWVEDIADYQRRMNK